PLPCTFLFRCYSAHAALHSLPTRRSSDLPPGDGSTGQRVRWRAVLAADSEAHPQDGGRGDQSLRVQMIVGITRVRNEALILADTDRKSTRLNSSHVKISYAVFCLKKKNKT